MFFRRRKAPDPPSGAWSDLAERLGLTRLGEDEAADVRPDLGADAGRVEELHVWRRDGLPELFLFEHARTRPGARRAEAPRARVVLRSREATSDLSWRAFPRSHPLLATLQANRTGGELVRTGDEAFDERIVVISRDVDAAADLMGPHAREALARLLAGDDVPEATVTSGRHHLAWRAHDEVDPAGPTLEAVVARLLVLWLAAGGASVAFGRDGDASAT